MPLSKLFDPSFYDSRLFRCDCGDPFHSLCIEWESEGRAYLSFAVVSEPLSFIRKLKAIWALLRGRRHHLHEVIVHRDEIASFVEYVNLGWDNVQRCESSFKQIKTTRERLDIKWIGPKEVEG